MYQKGEERKNKPEEVRSANTNSNRGMPTYRKLHRNPYEIRNFA